MSVLGGVGKFMSYVLGGVGLCILGIVGRCALCGVKLGCVLGEKVSSQKKPIPEGVNSRKGQLAKRQCLKNQFPKRVNLRKGSVPKFFGKPLHGNIERSGMGFHIKIPGAGVI